MTDEQSLRRGRTESDFHRDLAAMLDGADVSERVRAAIAHALTTADPLSAYPEAVINRGPAERERRSGRNRAPAGAYRMPRRWTLHLTYLAADAQEARDQAVVYTEGLTILRPELNADAALLSRADAWNHIEPVFCSRVGPDGEVCADATGHPGFHHAAGIDGLRWGDGDGTTGLLP
ncbi:hypothetical protein [Micromonospora sp. WMMD998]|uniref:hypothetical protein n=1 Tax=Micromonospora sp. WMMD998 TaxID=3016092 RepID=UPI002499EDF3|nr:hypothetical protein [Micromonospora sp. WMMD998]WFE41321.1 hypothetical protein O7619_23825 [Micromonospora sp. WMMD998]